MTFREADALRVRLQVVLRWSRDPKAPLNHETLSHVIVELAAVVAEALRILGDESDDEPA